MNLWLDSYAYLVVVPFYMLVIGLAADTMRLSFTQPPPVIPDYLMAVVRVFLLMAMCTGIIFILLQSSWILGQGYTGISPHEMAAWVTFDWLNGTAYLAFILAIRLCINWHRHESTTP